VKLKCLGVISINRKELIKLYIGSNNTTKKPEYQKAVKVVSKYVGGFNLNKNEIGYFNFRPEKCFSISIINFDGLLEKDIIKLKLELEKVLKQKEVLISVEKVGVI